MYINTNDPSIHFLSAPFLNGGLPEPIARGPGSKMWFLCPLRPSTFASYACFWTVGGAWSTRREPTQTSEERANSTHKIRPQARKTNSKPSCRTEVKIYKSIGSLFCFIRFSHHLTQFDTEKVIVRLYFQPRILPSNDPCTTPSFHVV